MGITHEHLEAVDAIKTAVADLRASLPANKDEEEKGFDWRLKAIGRELAQLPSIKRTR